MSIKEIEIPRTGVLLPWCWLYIFSVKQNTPPTSYSLEALLVYTFNYIAKQNLVIRPAKIFHYTKFHVLDEFTFGKETDDVDY